MTRAASPSLRPVTSYEGVTRAKKAHKDGTTHVEPARVKFGLGFSTREAEYSRSARTPARIACRDGVRVAKVGRDQRPADRLASPPPPRSRRRRRRREKLRRPTTRRRRDGSSCAASARPPPPPLRVMASCVGDGDGPSQRLEGREVTRTTTALVRPACPRRYRACSAPRWRRARRRRAAAASRRRRRRMPPTASPSLHLRRQSRRRDARPGAPADVLHGDDGTTSRSTPGLRHDGGASGATASSATTSRCRLRRPVLPSTIEVAAASRRRRRTPSRRPKRQRPPPLRVPYHGRNHYNVPRRERQPDVGVAAGGRGGCADARRRDADEPGARGGVEQGGLEAELPQAGAAATRTPAAMAEARGRRSSCTSLTPTTTRPPWTPRRRSRWRRPSSSRGSTRRPSAVDDGVRRSDLSRRHPD